MTSAKETLRSAIELLSESEAQEVAKIVRALQKRRGMSPTLARLAADPLFSVPVATLGQFSPGHAARGTGAAASKRLVQDRR
jgi:hypothetical protein